MKRLLAIFGRHSCHWGVPHARERDNRVVMTCYSCGRERELKVELRTGAL